MSYELSDEEIKALRRILEFEKEAEAYGEEVSWTWMDVAVLPRVVKSLEDKGLLRVVDKGPPKQYRLKDRKKAEKVLKERKIEVPEAPKIPLAVEKGKVEIPPDLFECIVGYDDIKKVILKSLKSDKPVHILFVGPPGSAKSLFLLELERLGAIFLTAGTSTRVGIRDTIFERLPRFLIIDELDKARDPKDLTALLTWMESGRIIIAKHGLRAERRGKGWVFAACNTDKKIPPELKSRFLVFKLKPYSQEEFVEVVRRVLPKYEGISEELAEYIAKKVSEFSKDVRDAVKVARLAKTREEVDEVVEILKRYR